MFKNKAIPFLSKSKKPTYRLDTFSDTGPPSEQIRESQPVEPADNKQNHHSMKYSFDSSSSGAELHVKPNTSATLEGNEASLVAQPEQKIQPRVSMSGPRTSILDPRSSVHIDIGLNPDGSSSPELGPFRGTIPGSNKEVVPEMEFARNSVLSTISTDEPERHALSKSDARKSASSTTSTLKAMQFPSDANRNQVTAKQVIRNGQAAQEKRSSRILVATTAPNPPPIPAKRPPPRTRTQGDNATTPEKVNKRASARPMTSTPPKLSYTGKPSGAMEPVEVDKLQVLSSEVDVINKALTALPALPSTIEIDIKAWSSAWRSKLDTLDFRRVKTAVYNDPPSLTHDMTFSTDYTDTPDTTFLSEAESDDPLTSSLDDWEDENLTDCIAGAVEWSEQEDAAEAKHTQSGLPREPVRLSLYPPPQSIPQYGELYG